MGKEIRSFSIDKDLDEQLDNRSDLNLSAIMNDLLREYLTAGRSLDAALSVRLDQIERELESARSERERVDARIEHLKQQRDELRSKIDRRESKNNGMVDEAVGKVRKGNFPRGNLEVDNPAVQNWATKSGLTPERFVDKVVNELDG